MQRGLQRLFYFVFFALGVAPKLGTGFTSFFLAPGFFFAERPDTSRLGGAIEIWSSGESSLAEAFNF
jgi:hypothetical protein